MSTIDEDINLSDDERKMRKGFLMLILGVWIVLMIVVILGLVKFRNG